MVIFIKIIHAYLHFFQLILVISEEGVEILLLEFRQTPDTGWLIIGEMSQTRIPVSIRTILAVNSLALLTLDWLPGD